MSTSGALDSVGTTQTIPGNPGGSMPPVKVQRVRRELPPWLGALVGIVSLLVVWTILASTVFGVGDGIPTPWAILAKMVDDGWSFYWPNINQTLGEAGKGYIAGNLIAFALALMVILVPWIEGVIMQLAVASYCLPILAIAPILQLFLKGDKPMIVLAAISVFFTSLVGILLGLRAADNTSLDLVRAYGGGRVKQLRYIRLINALPAVFAALKIAAPAALLGAIIGEFLGGIDRGLGPAMVNSQGQLEVARTWGLALAAGALAGIAYGLIGLIGKLVSTLR